MAPEVMEQKNGYDFKSGSTFFPLDCYISHFLPIMNAFDNLQGRYLVFWNNCFRACSWACSFFISTSNEGTFGYSKSYSSLATHSGFVNIRLFIECIRRLVQSTGEVWIYVGATSLDKSGVLQGIWHIK